MSIHQDDIEADDSHEVAMLRDINDAVSDYLLALENPWFAEQCGGVEVLLDHLRIVQDRWEQEYNTLTG